MTPIKTKNGKRLIKSRYYKITVEGRRVDLHRYLMEQKLGRRLERWEEVHHKDEDPHNNSLDNLELKSKRAHFLHHQPSFRKRVWTPAEREAYRIRFSGAGSTNAKLTQAQAEEIRKRASAGEKYRDLAIEFGVHHSCISDIKNNKAYRSYSTITEAAA